MTQDQFEKASVLLEEINTLIHARNTIKSNISLRETQIGYIMPQSPLFNWLRKCAGKCVIKANKLNLTVRSDPAESVEFEVDEGFIGTILLYLDARINEKTKELSEL